MGMFLFRTFAGLQQCIAVFARLWYYQVRGVPEFSERLAICYLATEARDVHVSRGFLRAERDCAELMTRSSTSLSRSFLDLTVSELGLVSR